MSPLDDLLERIRAAAGAEFVFVLTRQGKLVTPNAPRDMPETGRMRLARAADAVANTGALTSVSMPRGEIVPYGGPGPIDISLAVAAERAIVCVAMTAAAGRPRALSRLKEGLGAVASLILRAVESRKAVRKDGAPKRRGGGSKAKRSADEPQVAPQIVLGRPQPIGRETLAAIEQDLAESGAPPPAKPTWVAPEIVVERARNIGRETLAAIEADRMESGLPPVRISEGQLADPRPDIVVERARNIGRETMSAIEAEVATSDAPVPLPRIPPSALRRTLPWVEPEPDSGLTGPEARKNAAPRVSIKLEQADDELLKVALSAEVERIMDKPATKAAPRHPRSDARKGPTGEVKGPPRRS